MTPHRQPPDDRVIQAAGGILHRNAPPDEEVMVVHRKRYDDWTLPKGKLKVGESFQEAAVREVHEETGCVVRLGEYLGAVGYEVKGVPKVVLFWRMSLVEQNPLGDQEEIAEAVWLRVPDAIQRLTHAPERELLERMALRASA
jgi:8-oxo-dGTP diphosphatase